MANCYQAGEVFGFLRVIRAMLAMLFVTLLISNPVSAQLYSTKWIDQCHAEIPEPVPAFNCMDGHKVPKTIKNYNDGSGERKVCEHPEALYGRCVHGSRLGRLAKNNKDVDIIFSCRRDLNSNHEDVANRAKFFYDIAVIQRHRPTGKTCFYQYLGKYAEDEVVPAPMTHLYAHHIIGMLERRRW
ncbi:MAG: hypothetical protein GKR95_06845 [Gammaproteobacteria bacterium]|nr:hypothetical protein [Gammaproteobacteria bacterium]